MGFSASCNVIKNKNHNITNTNVFAFIYLEKNVVFILKCLVKAVRDDISAKIVPI